MSAGDYGKARDGLIRRNRERQREAQMPVCECSHFLNEHRTAVARRDDVTTRPGGCLAVDKSHLCTCPEFRQIPIADSGATT